MHSGPLTFSWVYPIVLTHLCSQNCAYCIYPITEAAPVPSLAKVREHAARARRLGVLQLRISSGEGIEPHAVLQSTLGYYGFRSFSEYLQAIIGEFTQNTVVRPLLPELDMGAVPLTLMQQLRPHIFAVRLYLESMDERVKIGPAHGDSPAKHPVRRVEALLNAGRLGIPVNSGTMIGIGESQESRIKALETLAEISRRYHHIQSVTIHPFTPAVGTLMHDHAMPTAEEMLEVVAAARQILPEEIVVSYPAMLYPDRIEDFIRAGAGDLGEIELTGDVDSDARAKQFIRTAQELLNKQSRTLNDRLAIHPRFANAKWVTPKYAALLAGLNTGKEQE